MVVALGPAIEVQKIPEPSQEQVCHDTLIEPLMLKICLEQVDSLHEKYCEALCSLFDRHKHKLEGWEHRKLYFEDVDLTKKVK